MSGATTAVFAGLIAVQAFSQISTANSQAKASLVNSQAQADALKKEGDITVSEKAKEVRLRAARQVSSFITSGLELEGTPMDVLDETFEVGVADIENIGSNYQTQRMNVLRGGKADALTSINQGRTAAIGSISSGFASYGGSGSLFDSSTQSNRGVGGVPIPVKRPTTGGFG